MKKTVVSIVAGIMITGLFAFKSLMEKGLAVVEQKQGVYVFEKCKPKNEYTYLGNVKSGVYLNLSGITPIERLIKRAKEAYPDVEAIMPSEDQLSADVIKFKE